MVPLFRDRFGRLRVADQSGRMIGARLVDEFPGGPGPDDPSALDIRPVPGNTHELFVGWIGGACDFRGRLLLDRSGTSLTLRFAPGPGCDAVGIGRGVILEFAGDIDATAMTGHHNREPLVSLDGFVPVSIAFADRNVGWIGGTNAEADALVLHTLDGGATWTTSGLGEGQVTEIAAIDGQHAFATLECAEHQFGCSSGTFRWDEDFGGWGKAVSDRFVHMDFTGQHGVAVALPPDEEAPIVPALQVNDDGGDTVWTSVDNPCPDEMGLSAAERTSPRDLLVLCLAEGGTGGTFKTLLASEDNGTRWLVRSKSGLEGSGLAVMGTPTGFDVAADGSGWMWGSRMPLLHTTDAGASWTGLAVADGDVRILNDASYLGAAAGFVLLQDPDRQAVLLLWTRDGQTWEELRSWPLG
jgi:hypothetical protein